MLFRSLQSLQSLKLLKQISQMPEATLIFLDNSQYSINGDYPQTRWTTEIEAVGLLIPAKMQNSRQQSVGLGLMAGRQVQIICPPTNDPSKVESFLYGIKVSGLIKFCHALQVGALALKHRIQPTHKQRMVCFIASTVTDSKQQMRIIGRKLKKNGVAVDIICIGDLSIEQKQKLSLFHDSVNHEDNSNIIFVEPGINLSDVLLDSKIFGSEQYNQMNGEVDDPELALALRLSLQEAERINVVNAPGPSAINNQNSQMEIQNQEQQLQRRALELSLQSLHANLSDQTANKGKQQQKENNKQEDNQKKQ